VILIHGLMDSAFHWHKNIDALAEHHRVWAIDLIGFGFSSRPREPNYSLKAYARHVFEFMDAQGIDRASIVGHSLGGAVALEIAHDYPKRVDKLILIAPATFLLQFRPQIKLAAHLPMIPRAIVGYAITSARARMAAWRGAVGDPSHVDLEEMEIRLRPQRVKGTAEALLAMLGSPHQSDLPEGLNRIIAPTLILSGKNDSAVPLRHGGYHEHGLPNGEWVVLEGAGHIPQSEYPRVFNRLVLDFLARNENSGRGKILVR
jgi:pimeloyl-ACP methyl ester carboxylesterase